MTTNNSVRSTVPSAQSVLVKRQEIKLNLTESQCRKLEKLGYNKVRNYSSFVIRYDDRCNNNHNSFSITGTIYDADSYRGDCTACGCLHTEFALVFPEYKHLLKWHGWHTDYENTYINNTIYFTSDKDYNGLLKGEVSRTEKRLKFKGFKSSPPLDKIIIKWLEHGLHLQDIELIRVDHVSDNGYIFNPSFYFSNMDEIDKVVSQWHKSPFKSEQEALNLLHDVRNQEWDIVEVPVAWSKGKERELDKARKMAIWEDATDEQLCLPEEELRTILKERYLHLIAEFRKDVESLGLIW